MLEIALYILLLVGVAASAVVTWWLSLSRKRPDLRSWRRRLLLIGLIANTASLVLFLGVAFQAILVSTGAATSDALVRNYRSFFPLQVSLGAVVFGAFGKRVPRILLILSGLALAFLWLNFAASSL